MTDKRHDSFDKDLEIVIPDDILDEEDEHQTATPNSVPAGIKVGLPLLGLSVALVGYFVYTAFSVSDPAPDEQDAG